MLHQGGIAVMRETDSSNSEIGGCEQACPACGAPCELSGERLAGYPLSLCRRCGARAALTAMNATVDYNDAYASGLYSDQTVEQMQRNEAEGLSADRLDTYVPFFREVKPSANHNTVLDIGCGGGRFCRAATRSGWKTLGIDVSNVALDFARRISPLDYLSIDLDEVARLRGRFDVITAFEVLEHQAKVRHFLECVRATLKDRGRFFCTVPAWEHPEVRSATRLDWIPPIHLLFFTRASLGATLRLNGFEVVRTGYIPAGPEHPAARVKWAARRWVKRLLGAPQHALGIWGLARPAGLT